MYKLYKSLLESISEHFLSKLAGIGAHGYEIVPYNPFP